MKDDKYVVFKRDQFDAGVSAPLDDAVVIRLQDVFASAALYTYANTIAVALSVLRTTDGVDRDLLSSLQSTADYFAECAEDAGDYAGKLPD